MIPQWKYFAELYWGISQIIFFISCFMSFTQNIPSKSVSLSRQKLQDHKSPKYCSVKNKISLFLKKPLIFTYFIDLYLNLLHLSLSLSLSLSLTLTQKVQTSFHLHLNLNNVHMYVKHMFILTCLIC